MKEKTNKATLTTSEGTGGHNNKPLNQFEITTVTLLAVEWLYDEIKHIIPNDFLNKFKQAKEMEKKIIAQAFEDGDYNYFYNHQNGKDFENGIEYYNEKFKSE